jgi:hypothetical protein
MLKKEDGLNTPYGIAFSKTSSKVFIVNHMEKSVQVAINSSSYTDRYPKITGTEGEQNCSILFYSIKRVIVCITTI